MATTVMLKYFPSPLYLTTTFIIIIATIINTTSSTQRNNNNEFKVKNPCVLTKNIKSGNSPIIRVVDDINDERGVVLGHHGLLYYTLISSRVKRDVVIDCSSSFGAVKWGYKGFGASSGFKILTTRWTSGGDLNKSSSPVCYSSSLIITYVTDQLTGEYSCEEVNNNGTRSNKPRRRNSFKLFVPSIPPTYPQFGSEVNITVASSYSSSSTIDQRSKLSKFHSVVIPCIGRNVSDDVILHSVHGNNESLPVVAEYKNMRYDPFAGFIVPQSSIRFEANSSILRHECKFGKDEGVTFLKVNLVKELEEKFAPEEKATVKSSAPYLSWTTKVNPKLQFSPEVSANSVMIWQQFFTERGVEEVSRDAPAYYLGSVTLTDLGYGREGDVGLYDGDDDGLIYKWRYFVLDSIAEQNAGLKYEDYEYFHVFVCKSASDSKPDIKFRYVEGFPASEDVSKDYNITDCPDDDMKKYEAAVVVGCVILTSYVPQGEVICVGDGVDERIRYPLVQFEAGRPFFVERGSKLVFNLPNSRVIGEEFIIPCVTNSEQFSTSVYLYKRTVENGFKQIWPNNNDDDTVSSGEVDIDFYPASGFHLTAAAAATNRWEDDLIGEYLCSSDDGDPGSDRRDSVVVIIRKERDVRFKMFPVEKKVFGRSPFKFSWEASEDLEIVVAEGSTQIRNITIGGGGDNNGTVFGGKLIIMENIFSGERRNLVLKRKLNGEVLHSWVYTQIDRNVESEAGLRVERKEGTTKKEEEELLVFTCRSKSNVKPEIRYYHCQNEETCDLMKDKCHQKDCFNPFFYHEDKGINGGLLLNDCEEDESCNGAVFRSSLINGILNVSCVGDGVDAHIIIRDVFFKEDIIKKSEMDEELSDEDYIHLSTSYPVHAADQNPEREIHYIGANVEWELGESVEFSCVAAPFLYSNGIRWAVEMRSGGGRVVWQKDSIFDVQFKYFGSTQVASSFTLLIDRPDYSRVYCFVPKLGSATEWRNVSMPIFVKSEITDDYCHDSNSIHLINIHPSPSKLNLNLSEVIRLDKLPYFVVPQDVLQFAVKISGTLPFTWVFTGAGVGPTRTPLIQSDRQVIDFYDSSTYCYSSRLLINLRHKTVNDTGRYTVRRKYGSREEVASFYVFVPSQTPPYLLRSGSSVNITLPQNDEESYYVPCLVNNPDISVELKMFNSTSEEGESVVVVASMYDPTRGFLIINNNNNKSERSTGEQGIVYKCVVKGDDSDYLIVYANLPIRTPEFKYEKVNDFHVFTCRSNSTNLPVINLTGFSKNGDDQLINTTSSSSAGEYYNKKITRCGEGCVALIITQVNQGGSVVCVGDGIDEVYRFPSNYNAYKRNTDDNVIPTKLWYDNSTHSFKCQILNSNQQQQQRPTLAAVTCRRPNECEIMKTLLQQEGDKSQIGNNSECGKGCSELWVKKESYATNWFSIFVKCYSNKKGGGEDNNVDSIILSQYFYHKDEMLYASIENVEKLKRIRIDVPVIRKHGDVLYATFQCFANRYFYSRGIQWGLEGRNGVIEFPAVPATQVEIQSFSAVMSTIELEIHESFYNAIYCFVPLLDSSGWVNSTVEFPIDGLRINI